MKVAVADMEVVVIPMDMADLFSAIKIANLLRRTQ
jgi:hypothetical protein